MAEIDQLPKPTLIHCKSGMRSGFMSLIYFAQGENLSAEQALVKGKQLGFNFDGMPPIKQLLQQYLTNN